MQLTSLALRNFRCFDDRSIALTAPRIIIEGPNGSGKSSIVESLHYCCYLRSFRIGQTRDIANKNGDGSFFIKLAGNDTSGEPFTIQVGFSQKTKRVKVNDKVAHTYKEVMAHYRVVTVAEHDLALIQDGPEYRRSFINQFCLLDQPAIADLLRQHKQIVQQRNGLILSGNIGSEQGKVWTQQLWDVAEKITVPRITALAELEKQVNSLFGRVRDDAPRIGLTYARKHRQANESFEQFWERYQPTLMSEANMKRTLFGAHLDDIVITLNGRSTRSFASRGQQKLILVLLKLAQVSVLQQHAPSSGLLLVLDDLITDFDATVLKQVLTLINELSCAVLITCPLAEMVTLPEPVQVIKL